MISPRRLTTAFLTTAVLSGAVALVPQAASAATPAPVTGTATAITTTGATLNAAISPGGNAVTYQFQYGTTTGYGQTTTPVTLPAQTANEVVSANIAGLKAGGTYHFRIAVNVSSGANSGSYYYYYSQPSYGLDASFTTKTAGKVTLGSKTVAVKHDTAAIKLDCASTQTCKGKLSFSDRVKVGKKFQNKSLGSKSFSITASKKGTVKVKLNKTGGALLTLAKHHRLKVTLSGKFSTGQPSFSKKVTLQG